MTTASIPSQMFGARAQRPGLIATVSRYWTARQARKAEMAAAALPERWCDATEREINNRMMFGRNYSKM